MFVRRVYYIKATGEVPFWYMQTWNEDVAMPTIQEDMALYPALRPYAQDPDAIGVLEWLQPQQEIEDAFGAMGSVAVDVTAQAHALVFYPPAEEEAMEDAETASETEG